MSTGRAADFCMWRIRVLALSIPATQQACFALIQSITLNVTKIRNTAFIVLVRSFELIAAANCRLAEVHGQNWKRCVQDGKIFARLLPQPLSACVIWNLEVYGKICDGKIIVWGARLVSRRSYVLTTTRTAMTDSGIWHGATV